MPRQPIPFGNYALLERIAMGGFAEVFKARPRDGVGNEELVAIKRIRPDMARDAECVALFLEEANTASQLHHQNIARIVDLGQVHDRYFIALEYVEGRDLGVIMDHCRARGEPLPLGPACFVVIKLCAGLEYVHTRRDRRGQGLKLVHRDVKPRNVLVSFGGEVKLTDFGVARSAGKRPRKQVLLGTYAYMSPEQVRGLPVDRRSDIFSVGIILYELLTGQRLFAGESDLSTIVRVRDARVPRLSASGRKIPRRLERIVRRALARDPDERHARAAELREDLRSFLRDAGVSVGRGRLASWMRRTFPATDA